MKLWYWIRWLSIPVACASAALLVYVHTRWWAYRGLSRRWIEPVAFFQVYLLAALIVAWIAPRHKLSAVLVLGLLGLPMHWGFSAKFDPITQQPTCLPFLAGITGGLAGLALSALILWLQRPRPTDM